MNQNSQFSERDIEQLSSCGIDPHLAGKQLAQLRQPPAATVLERACTTDDGITQLSEEDHEDLLSNWRQLVESERVVKFVPASGAASRMFKDLRAFLADEKMTDSATRFGESIDRFAFYDRLRSQLGASDKDRTEILSTYGLESVIRTLLSTEGLGFEALPKGLIPFHSYPDGARTALVEHLYEGAGYLSPDSGTARFHFTVSEELQSGFEAEIESERERLQTTTGRTFEVDFSHQSPATDTLAIEPDGEPFRLPGGELLLRPSGHGALIDNLDRLGADVAFIKNIDNIAPSARHGTTVLWKSLLAGYFARLRDEAVGLAARLESTPTDPATIEQAIVFLRRRFSLQPGPHVTADDHDARSAFARQRLDRPIRVAGMVRNEREPGGGPFWVRNKDGSIAPQIVEGSQVDLNRPDQSEIWNSATHLNPVDLVCGLVDRWGRSYSLTDFIDYDMSFVVNKSYAGRPLVGLERPGLWNGSMAGWNTAFVEVPIGTFTPVKTIFDLLRDDHQPH